jgi:hypothetical protein
MFLDGQNAAFSLNLRGDFPDLTGRAPEPSVPPKPV